MCNTLNLYFELKIVKTNNLGEISAQRHGKFKKKTKLE